jgi:ankyrin repeat protein
MPVSISPLLVFALLLLVLISGCGPKPAGPGTTSTAANNAPAARSADEIALLDASIKGDTAAVKSLLDKGVNPNTKDGDGRTPFTEAAFYGHTEIARMLIDHGADIFAKKRDGASAITTSNKDIAQLMKRNLELINVARIGDDKGVKDLLDQGAYVNMRDADGRTALTEAAWNNHLETVRLLLEKGADVNAKKNDGTTPLSIATGRGAKEIAELLKKAGAK